MSDTSMFSEINSVLKYFGWQNDSEQTIFTKHIFKNECFMKIDTYVNKKNSSIFLSIEAVKKIIEFRKFLDDTEFSLWKTGISLNEFPLIALNQVEVSNNIKNKGYAIHYADIKCTIKNTINK